MPGKRKKISAALNRARAAASRQREAYRRAKAAQTGKAVREIDDDGACLVCHVLTCRGAQAAFLNTFPYSLSGR